MDDEGSWWGDGLGAVADVVAEAPVGAVEAFSTPGAAMTHPDDSAASLGRQDVSRMATVVTPPSSQQDRLLALQDEIFEANLAITQDATRFRDIDPGDERPPQAWINELGEADAWKRFRVARSAWLGAKDAPVALSMAKSIVSAMSKSAAMRAGGGRVLNIECAIFPTQVYERQVFSGDE